MTSRQQFATVFLVVAVAVSGLALLNHFLRDELKPMGVGVKAPEFQAMSIADTSVKKSLADYKGNVVMLNVWATWCAPCRAEMPSIEQLYKEYEGRGFKVVAVSIDDSNAQDGIREFATELGLTFDILHDPAGAIQQIYQTTGVPETIIVGRDGVVRNKVVGAVNWYSPSNRKLIERFLAE